MSRDQTTEKIRLINDPAERSSDAAQSGHLLQFYEDDSFLLERMVKLLAPALAASEPVVILATREHRHGFTQRLASSGFDVERACATEQLVVLDAAETLARIVSGGQPDPQLFKAVIGRLFSETLRARPHARPRAQCEMVDLLWRAGDARAAIRLEELWNDLVTSDHLTLLCACSMSTFHRDGEGKLFDELCRAHRHVSPTEEFSRLVAPEERLREISSLQRRARVLESEIEQRTALERALRAAQHERAALEEALRREQETLARSNRDLDQFAYTASHDLKAPLRAIASLSRWVEEEQGERMTELAREQMKLLRGRVHRMEALIDGVLAWSRAGREREAPELVDVGQLLAEILETIPPIEGMRIDVAPGMPVFESERQPLFQVFHQLIGNAVKYTRRPDARIAVRASEEHGVHHFSVQDNGPGIATAYHARIWRAFTTLEPRDVVEGTGIGLSIVKEIVEARGGRAWVESEVGHGATFHFLWPHQAPSP